MSTLSFVCRLSPPLVVIITQYLSLYDKLTQLTHVSPTSFPVLTPPAFECDMLTLTPAVRRAWMSSAALRRLLSCVGALVLRETVEPPTSHSGSPLLDSWLPLSPQPSLLSCVGCRHLELDGLGNDVPLDCVALIAALPRLTSLHIRFRYQQTPTARPQAFWSPLSSLSELRTLVVSQPGLQLDYSTFRFLCSLPLVHFDLAAVEVVASNDGAAGPEPVQPTVTDTWQLLRLPCCGQPPMADECLAVMDQHCARVSHSDPSGPASSPPRLRYLSLHACHWPDTVRRLVTLSSSLISLELHQPHSSFTPLSLLDTDTGNPRLPHLQHLSIGRRFQSARPDLSVEEADSRTRSIARLCHSYRNQLRRIALCVPIGSSCWPLLEGVFSCCHLRRCDLSIDFRLQKPTGGIDFQGVRAALQPNDEPPCLPALLELHTLHLELPLTAAELQRVLHASRVLQELRLGQIYVLDALQCTCFIGQYGSPRLRALYITAMLRLTIESNSALPSAASVDSHPQPVFPGLIYLKVDGHLPSWSGPALQQLVQLLRHAPLLYLDLVHAPLQQLHHLSSLSHLRSLLTSASEVGMHDMGGDMPPELHQYFRAAASIDGQDGWYGGWAEMQRRLLANLIDVEAAAVTDEELSIRAERGLTSQSRHMFVRERSFHGMDGRDAYMQALQTRNAQPPEQQPPPVG